MVVLVTGGAGYIGSHTCVELLNSGYDIIVVDDFSNSKPEALHRVAMITGRTFETYDVDLLDKASLANVFCQNKIDAVMHFAGLKAVGESTIIPLRYYQNNMMGTVNLCEVMREHGVKKFVFSSSATVYGEENKAPIDEKASLGAVNPYGKTKQMIEEMLHDLSASDPTWSITILRYFNPIGAHESGWIGEDPNGIPNNLLPYMSQVAAGKIQRLNIYGDNYATKDGTGVRDYIHVMDLASGHVKALEKMQSGTGIDTFNLGTGKGYSVIEMVRAFEKATNHPIPYKIVEPRQGDVAVSYASTNKAKEHLGFQAARSLDVMCADTWRWQLNNPNGYEKLINDLVDSRSPFLHETGSFY